MILNLSEPCNYSIKFKVSKFPDGQQSITILEGEVLKYDMFEKIESVSIKSRIDSFLDLELIVCANKALRELGVKETSLEISYLLGARSDRKFETGSVNYIKEVLAPIINSQGFSKVTILDPHSDVSEACIGNFKKLTQYTGGLITFVFTDYFNNGSSDYSKMRLISPDAGALKKVYDVAESIEYKNDVIIASKHRDVKTGKITHTEVPLKKEDLDKDLFILDDICDGGRTFIEIAKAARVMGATGKIFLVVTHGIFSAGLKPLNDHFDCIYTTNSYVDISNPEFSLKNDNELHKLKQFKVI
jgi:ribose-phosphate pyrophosphokinase